MSRTRSVFLFASAVLLSVIAAAGQAQDIAAGRRVAAQVCQTCHGLDGLAKQPEIPNLAAMDQTYLVRQLEAFRTGCADNDMMSAVIGMAR